MSGLSVYKTRLPHKRTMHVPGAVVLPAGTTNIYLQNKKKQRMLGTRTIYSSPGELAYSSFSASSLM